MSKGGRLALLALALVVTALVATGVGAVRLNLADPMAQKILFEIRLPRIALACLVGAALALGGTGLQGLLRNPLADPYLLGVSSGASLGAALAYYFTPQLPTWGLGIVPLFAFVGALGVVLLVVSLGRHQGRLSTLRLILAGVAVAALADSIKSFLLTTAPEPLQRAMTLWQVGGLSAATWRQVWVAAPYIALGGLVLLALCRELNLILMGEEAAAQLGVPVERVKALTLGASALVAAAAVAVSGPIGFVGLVVPHMLRLLFGPDHRWLLPASALGGALFLLAIDTLGRVVVAPQELRVSILTGLVGAPFFLCLLRKSRGG